MYVCVCFDSLCMLFSYGKFLVESLGTHLLGERQVSNLLWLQKYNASDFPKPNGSVKETVTILPGWQSQGCFFVI